MYLCFCIFRLFSVLIDFLRKQYVGSVPLTTIERYSDLIRQAVIDYHEAYKNLRFVQKQKNDLIICEDNFKMEMKNITELKALLSSNKEFHNILDNIHAWSEEKNSLQLNVSIYFYCLFYKNTLIFLIRK